MAAPLPTAQCQLQAKAPLCKEILFRGIGREYEIVYLGKNFQIHSRTRSGWPHEQGKVPVLENCGPVGWDWLIDQVWAILVSFLPGQGQGSCSFYEGLDSYT